jgi:hypothetical protein
VGRGPGTTAAASNESLNGSGSADTWAAAAPKLKSGSQIYSIKY